jgi:hypothetical protein
MTGIEEYAETENSDPVTVAAASCSSLSEHDSEQDSAESCWWLSDHHGGSATIAEQHLLLLDVFQPSPVAFQTFGKSFQPLFGHFSVRCW